MTVFNPIQFYFVPIRESDLIKQGAAEGDFEIISGSSTTDDDDIRSLVSISIAAENTVVIYDNWEDGLEFDITNPTQSTTYIFGDGDLSNNGGLTPAGVDDIFQGGESFVLSSIVGEDRTTDDIYFDGGDQIAATFPIAVTRAAFPTTTGSVIAGATEALDIDSFGDRFVVPIGPNIGAQDSTNAFEYTAAHVMASANNTKVFVNGEEVATLNAGESYVLREIGGRNLNTGDEITTYDPASGTSGKGVQVHLVTGDINSNYETRWYSLTPRDQWASEYWTPVFTGENSADFDSGSGFGPTQVWLYNPNSTAITVQADFDGSGNDTSVVIGAGQAALSPIIPDDSGGRFYTNDGSEFFAVTQTDTTGDGLFNDWGAPLVAVDQLTSQVSIALGYGNTSQINGGNSGDNRSTVWVTPTEDARIFVDYDGDGTADDSFDLDRLESVRVSDPTDNNMSGAIIWAVDQATGNDTVDIAVAYGQDPETRASESVSLDLGTVIPPLPELESAKLVSLSNDADGDGVYSSGDTVTYTIVVANSGRVDVGAGGYVIDDFGVPVFDTTTEGDGQGPLTYVAGSARVDFAPYAGGDVVSISDDALGATLFPLDGAGWASTRTIAAGDVHLLRFEAKIKDFDDLAPGTTSFTNEGAMVANGLGLLDEFSVTRELSFTPDVNIEKYTNGVDVTSGAGPTLANGSAVTWTYVVTNTGNTALANVVVTDDQEGTITSFTGDTDNDGILDLSEAWTFTKTGTAQNGAYVNLATVAGDAAYADAVGGQAVLVPVANGGATVTDTDASRYVGVQTGAITGTVFDDANADGQEEGLGIAGATVELLDAGGNVVGTTTADANGDYAFTGLLPADYAVRFQTPGGRFDAVSPQNQGADATDSDADAGTLTTGLITVPAGVTVSDIDQGFYTQNPTNPAIDIEKFTNSVDVASGNGPDLLVGSAVTWTYVVKNTGDAALANVSVVDDQEGVITSFTGDTDNDNILDVTETWTFTKSGVATLGQYQNEAVVTADAAFADPVGGNPVLFPTGNGGAQVTDKDTSAYSGFGLGSLSGTVFEDPNADGQEDGIGIAGATVELLDGTGAVVETTTTDANGDYLFEDVISGDYTVRFTRPGAQFDGVSPQDQGVDGTDSDGNPTTLTTAPVTIPVNGTVTDVDQGFYVQNPSNPGIDIEKFTNGVDVTTGNGPTLVTGSVVTWTYVVKNTGDTALANISVVDDREGAITSFVGDTDNDNILDVTETWTFVKSGFVQTGQYENEAVVTGDAAFADPVGGNPVLFPTGNGGAQVTDSDISKYVGVGTGALTGTVFEDADADGQENGVGIAGATVELLDAGNNVVATTTTDANGDYLFDDVTAGDYSVRFVQPGVAFDGVSPQNQGDDASDSDGNPTTLTTAPVTVPAGVTVRDVDQGFFKMIPAIIGNRVWDDVDGDGRQDKGEAGLAGVTVRLLDANGNPVLEGGVPVTTFTNAKGKYKFEVEPGTYMVEFDALPNRGFTDADVATGRNRDSDADTMTGRTEAITVNWGEVRNDIDAGMVFHLCTDIADEFAFPKKRDATIVLNDARPHANGTNGDDIIWGRGKADTISGNDGDNIIMGRSGNDILNGGNQTDLLQGGRGNDILNGNAGHDSLTGGRGNDKLYGGGGDDIIMAGRGRDLVEAGGGNDRINLGAGNDTAQGEGGDDCIAGGTDHGRIAKRKGELTVTRMGDELFGNGGADTFEYMSGDGVDFLFDFKKSDGDQLKLFRIAEDEVDFIRVQTQYGPAAGLGIDQDGDGRYEGAIIFQQTQNPNNVQAWVDDGTIVFLI